jgi:hypothetical protein
VRRRIATGLAGLAIVAGGALAGTALADPNETQAALLEGNWFVELVQEEGNATTVRFSWTDSYFARNACREARKAAGGIPAGRVSVAFGDAAPRTCAQVAKDPDASIAGPPASADAGATPVEPETPSVTP